jgi:metal-responsive CopG/Arc/MetJ family transcriptional regulator
MAKEPELTEKVTFWTDLTQRMQLDELHEKESVNKSKFIRDAIREKLQRWRERNGERAPGVSRERESAARHRAIPTYGGTR